jgi:hypothetical protein
MNSLKEQIGKYIFPAILVLLGLLMLIMGMKQNWLFKIGGAAIALVGIVATLNIAGILSKMASTILMVVMILGSAGLAYLNYQSIENQLVFIKKKELVASHVIQRLKDIRTAELAYKDANGRFTANWDTLTSFVLTGQIPQIRAFGEKPDTLSEQEAIALGLIVRDTVYQTVLENQFLSEVALNKRNYPFYVDSLRYVPFGEGTEFNLQASVISDASGQITPVFQVEDPKPFAEPAFKVGSMEQATTTGNWTEEN